MKINDELTVNPIWDYKNGRRFQIIVVNKGEAPTFTTHRDMMAREYLKLTLTEADIFQLILELQKNLTVEAGPRLNLKLIQGNKKDE